MSVEMGGEEGGGMVMRVIVVGMTDMLEPANVFDDEI